MSKKIKGYGLLAVMGAFGLALTASQGSVPSQEQIVLGKEFGDPLPGLTPKEFELFRIGLAEFTAVETADEGLGPVFNGRSCAECHSIPRIGGSGTMTEVRAG